MDTDLTELGKRILDVDGLYSKGGRIRHSAISGYFAIQCSSDIDDRVYDSLEEATLQWLQLRIEGKI